jgi:hypothetical protein
MDKLTLLKAAAWDAAQLATDAWALHKAARMEAWNIGYRIYWQEAPEGTDIDDATERVDAHVSQDPKVKATRHDAMKAQHAARKAQKAVWRCDANI